MPLPILPGASERGVLPPGHPFTNNEQIMAYLNAAIATAQAEGDTELVHRLKQQVLEHKHSLTGAIGKTV